MSYYEEEKAEKEKELKRLQKMDIPQLKKELDERIKASLIEEIQDLPEKINRWVDKSIAGMITAMFGLKKDHWNDSTWEVDDHHKNSAVGLAVGEQVMAYVQHAVPDFLAKLKLEDPAIPPIKTAYQKYYREKLSEMLNEATWKVATENAEKRYREIMAEITGEDVDLPETDEG